jgi:ribonuclease HI
VSVLIFSFVFATICVLSINNRVQLLRVPGHRGIIGNEEADDLARVGSKSSFCGPEPCLPYERVTKECKRMVVK